MHIMPQMKVRLGDIKPNPFRNIDAYPIDRTKVDALKASMENTSFWPVIVGRINEAGEVEQAFGHHRLAAAKELYGDDHEYTVTIETLSDDDMLKMMANENMQEYASDFRAIVETVRATRAYLRLGIPASSVRTRSKFAHEPIRSADGRMVGSEPAVDSIKAINEFLNWTGQSVTRAMAYLNAEADGIITPEDVEGLSLYAVQETRNAVERAIQRHAEAAPKEVKDSIRREAYTRVRAAKDKVKTGDPVMDAIYNHADKPGVGVSKPLPPKPPAIVPTSVVTGLASAINQVRISMRDLNDLLIDHPEVADFVRKVEDLVGVPTLPNAIVNLYPELDMLRDVVVSKHEPKPRVAALPEPATVKVITEEPREPVRVKVVA